MAREDFEGIRQHAKEQHVRRIAETPQRIHFAENLFKKNGIEYVLLNEQTGHFHCWRKRDGKLFQFYAGTGKIQGELYARGVYALVDILTARK